VTDTIPEDHYEGRDLEAMANAVSFHRWILSVFRPYLGKRVLEVGAGCGNFTQLLTGENIEHLIALEPARNMYVHLEKNAARMVGVTAVEGSTISYAEESSEPFDTLIYKDVMEHIEDPDEELRRAHEMLQAGGHLLIFVPAMQILYSNFDKEVGHYCRFKLSDLRKKVEDAGFTIEEARYFDRLGAPLFFLYFTLLGNTLTNNNVSVFDKVLVPVSKLIDRLMPLPFGKNIILSARR
jgi:cyclopropane fatty-acyl-phospholipid synthase-like methyltransferase